MAAITDISYVIRGYTISDAIYCKSGHKVIYSIDRSD